MTCDDAGSKCEIGVLKNIGTGQRYCWKCHRPMSEPMDKFECLQAAPKLAKVIVEARNTGNTARAEEVYKLYQDWLSDSVAANHGAMFRDEVERAFNLYA